MKLITYNVNGIRAAIQKGFFEWMKEADPDILLLQETKAQPEQIPVLDFEMMGYRNYWHSAQKKGYSGVAILTKKEPDKVVTGIGIKVYDDEGRFLRADYGDLTIISTRIRIITPGGAIAWMHAPGTWGGESITIWLPTTLRAGCRMLPFFLGQYIRIIARLFWRLPADTLPQ
jgi:hypothetical protein